LLVSLGRRTLTTRSIQAQKERIMETQPGSESWKDIERSGWTRNASGYDARAGRMTNVIVEPMLSAVGAVAGARLLDVCCGPGYVAGAAAARGLAAVGIDITPAMVDEARSRFPDAEFHEGDAENLDFPDASFDAVTCAFGLLHLPDARRAIAEANRVLVPGGSYAFSVWCLPEKARLLDLALKAITAHADMDVPLPKAPAMFEFSEPEVARAALEEAGFTGVAVQEVPIAFEGGAPEDVFEWFDKSTVRTMALFRLQKPAVQARIRDAILDSARAYATGGTFRIPCPALLWHARKA
jgi:ubiquinone/menaquinone biosynthesis C-methylase UbiE